MYVVKETISKKLGELLINLQKEFYTNIEHDCQEDFAWNALVHYLMEIEKSKYERFPTDQ